MSSATLSAKTGWLRAGNRGWSIGSVFIALVISLPLLVIVSFLLQPSNDNWQHLWNYLLADYVRNTVILGLGVGIGVLLIGVSTAWLTSMCDFPGRRWLSWALLLPMAIPAYIIAYTTPVCWISPAPYKQPCATFSVGKLKIIGFLRYARSAALSAC